MGRIAKLDYWFFLNEILDYRWMDDWLHGEEVIPFIDRYETDPGCLLLVPRGHGKSGGITSPRLAWWLAKNPLVTSCICNAAEQKANQMARVNAGIIARNKKYQKCFPEVVQGDNWGDKGYWLNLDTLVKGEATVERIDPSIGSYGVLGNITGAHWSGGMVHDDIVNEEIASSPTKMQKVRVFYGESMNTLDDYVPLVVIGTRWDYSDIYADLIEGTKGGKHAPLEQMILGIKDKDGYYIWPRTTYFDMADRKVIVGWDDATNKAAEANAGPRYSALYWNNPVRDSDRQFDVAMIKHFLKDPPFDLGPVARVGVECDSQASGLAEAIREIMKKENRNFPLEGIKAPKKQDKHDRIRAALQHWIADGQCHIERTIMIAEHNLGSELMDFPKGKDDCADAFAHATNLAHEGSSNSAPNVYIFMDPAFSTEDHADATAIVAVCKYNGELYALACDRFKTSKTDIQARRLFLMVDRFSKPHHSRRGRRPSRTIGFRGVNERRSDPLIAARRYDDGFHMQPLIPKENTDG